MARADRPECARATAALLFDPAVTRELDVALGAHELVKVRARVGDRDERNSILDELAKGTGSTLVQRIGNVGVFYRPSKDKPRITLPGD
jgi:RNA-binding protein